MAGKPNPGPGAYGFSETGEFDFAVGALHGLRVWNLGPGGALAGGFGHTWNDGENVAVCPKTADMVLILVAATREAFTHWCRDQGISPSDKRIRLVQDSRHVPGYPADTRWIEIRDGFLPLSQISSLRRALDEHYSKADYHTVRARLKQPDNPHPVPGPGRECGCGFWAYWTPGQARSVFWPARPVLGVIEGYGKTRIGEKGFRAARAKIIAATVMFEWGDGRDIDYQMRNLTEDKIAERYPSVNLYCTAEAMLAVHPPTQDYLPEPDPPPRRTVAEVKMPQLQCPAGFPLSVIERGIRYTPGLLDPPNVPGMPVSTGLKAQHADGSECEHLPRFLASGGKAVITHDKGQVTVSYSRGSQALAPGNWSAAAAPQQMSHALQYGLAHHPDGRPRAAGGNSTICNLP